MFLESGLCFEADIVRGQKTGFFLDQRENRRRVGELAAGRDVLNAFSFSGGFALHAARGGAKSVTDLDLSEHALAGARRNFALNANVPTIAACHHECVRADAFRWLARKPDRQFGLLVIDPPSLAKRETDRATAIDAYRHLNADALRWLAPRRCAGGSVVFRACQRGGIFWRRSPRRPGHRPAFHRTPDHQPRSRSPRDLCRGTVSEGNLPAVLAQDGIQTA